MQGVWSSEVCVRHSLGFFSTHSTSSSEPEEPSEEVGILCAFLAFFDLQHLYRAECPPCPQWTHPSMGSTPPTPTHSKCTPMAHRFDFFPCLLLFLLSLEVPACFLFLLRRRSFLLLSSSLVSAVLAELLPPEGGAWD